MKTIKVMPLVFSPIVFLVAVLLSFAPACHAQSQEASISASVAEEIGAFRAPSTPFTNASIIKAVVNSGSYPGLTAKDCAVVLADSGAQTLEVINTANSNSVLAIIGQCASNSEATGVETDSRTETTYEFIQNVYNITLPGVPAAKGCLT